MRREKLVGLVVVACILAARVLQAQPAPTEVVLHNFAPYAKVGQNPSGRLVADGHGNLYGTTNFGGISAGPVMIDSPGVSFGVVYKVDATGKETVLYQFTGQSDGNHPEAGLIGDEEGNLYGTTYYGGEVSNCFYLGCGVVFKVAASGQETVLHAFTALSDGAYPQAGVFRDAAGDLYGTTYQGGSLSGCSYSGCGTVYKLDPTTGNETVLYSFTGNADGSNPEAGVIVDAAGNIYGTTYGGGAGYGVIFKVDSAGRETVLHTFTGQTDGGYPVASLVRDASGNLYGTATHGGIETSCGNSGCGVVFKVDANGIYSVIYSFMGGTDGAFPGNPLTLDAEGNLYGTTSSGGASNSGTVFMVNPSGIETILYAFTNANGASPESGVIRDASGNLYGTTYSGGKGNRGLLYKLDPEGQESILYSFPAMTGTSPNSNLIADAQGDLYGTTDTSGESVVYKLESTGRYTVLADEGSPEGVVRDANNNLYGATVSGGTANSGTLYKVDATGVSTVLYNFPGGVGGQQPGEVIRDGKGNLYGVTNFGGDITGACGSLGCGLVFKFNVDGQFTVLYTFTGGSDGGSPEGNLLLDAAGNLYGTTNNFGEYNGGVLYKLDPAGNETVLYSFDPKTGPAYPTSGVVRDAAGSFYGIDSNVVYKVDAAGQFTALYTFTGGTDGGMPNGGVILDAAGNVYGTTFVGGDLSACRAFASNGCGVVYKVSQAGLETVLYAFTGGDDGANPLGGLLLTRAGTLYGTASAGGKDVGGVIFKIENGVEAPFK